jgi:hypothetical protein
MDFDWRMILMENSLPYCIASCTEVEDDIIDVYDLV